MSDLFDEKNIAPMLMHQSEPFDDEDYIYELKLDGIRCIAYLSDNEVTLRNKRNKDLSDLFPELNQMHKCAKTHCILDGELVSLNKEGKPDFFSLQKRALKSNAFAIELAAKNAPVQFVAYDILYADDKPLISLPQIERKVKLDKLIKEGNNLGVSRYIEKRGIDFFALAKVQGLEGVVAKRKQGIYQLGKRTREWVKFKVMIDEDLIICGYKLNDNGDIKDLILGAFSGDKLISRGSVSLGISAADKKVIAEFAKTHTVNKPWFNKRGVQWLELELVGVAHYMTLTDNNHMRQSVFKGLRFDKDPYDCRID